MRKAWERQEGMGQGLCGGRGREQSGLTCKGIKKELKWVEEEGGERGAELILRGAARIATELRNVGAK